MFRITAVQLGITIMNVKGTLNNKYAEFKGKITV